MAIRTPLVTGLGGAVGSEYRQSEHRLYFVEFVPGNLSVLDLIRDLDAVVFSGTATMPADSSLDLTDGTSARGGDIRWDHVDDAGRRVMRPQGNNQLANLGQVNFDAVTFAGLQDLSYSQASLAGEVGPGNPLADGDVFGVWNTHPELGGNFDYAKVQVLVLADAIELRWETYRLKPAYRVIGTGFTNPEDVVLSADGLSAWVSERSGDVVQVALADANRAAALQVVAGLSAPHQIALDASGGHAYVVEFADPGNLWSIDLATAAANIVLSGLHNAIGLLLAADGRFAYVTEQTAAGTGTLTRIDLGSGTRELLFSSTTAPLFFLTWSDPGQNTILVTERDPANTCWAIDLNVSPPRARALLAGVAARPSSVAVVSPDRLLVCSDAEIDLDDLLGDVFTAGGPLVLGIGFVPFDRVTADGYADTTGDAGYFYQVLDAPFGGTLPLSFNHDRAAALGAAFYQVTIDGTAQTSSFTDYLWDTSTRSFVAVATTPVPGGFYPVRQPGQLWYNRNLGGLFDTTGLANNSQHTISVSLFAAANSASVIDTAGEITEVRPLIDNIGPLARIVNVRYDGSPVGPCAIVHDDGSGSYLFSFDIIAYEANQHLQAWQLTAMWGDNKSSVVASDSYVHTASRLWPDPNTPASGFNVPAGGWNCVQPRPPETPDPTSYDCAHTFYLEVWDRVINGWYQLHSAAWHQSITIELPAPPA